MSTYRMEDGTVLKTENAKQSWEENTKWNGSNHVSVHTNDQWSHQKLHESKKGRYWIECWSAWQGSNPHAEWVSEHEAVRWLLVNESEVPESLEHLVEVVEE